MVQFWLKIDHEAHQKLLKKHFPTLSGTSLGIRNFHPSRLPPLLASSRSPQAHCHLPTVELAVLEVDRLARKVDLKQNGFKGVYPLSLTIGVSYKSICVPANEGWNWRILIGRYLDHSHSVNKGSERKPVSQCHNCCFANVIQINDAKYFVRRNLFLAPTIKNYNSNIKIYFYININ